MKNLMYIDTSYIFLINRDNKIVENYVYDDSDKKATLKYIFKKLKDNRYLNKNTCILKLTEIDAEIDEYLYNIQKIDIFTLKLYDYCIDKIICDTAIYKYDKISASYEKSFFDINLYSLDTQQLDNYLFNQVNDSKNKTLILLKHGELDTLENAVYLKDIFDIASLKLKKSIDISLFINIALDAVIVILFIALLSRLFLWESMWIN